MRMSSHGLTPDLMVALALADEADRITRGAYLDAELRVATKPDRTPVTEADQRVEQALRSMLAAQYPGDALLGEEFGGPGSATGRCWIIDPIDGTANFLRGVPVWATLIGLLVDGAPTVGVASAPALGRRWWAADGQAHTSDVDGRIRRLRTSDVSSWSDASLAYSDPIGWAPGALDRMAAESWRTRGFGDFLSHVLVAEGAVDVAVEPDLAPWDVAALLPIVAAAGGRTSGTDGRDVLEWSPTGALVGAGMVTSNAALHDEALRRYAG
ncbi:MAG: hypothetical protein RLZ55_99 [Actinomycetota bacterium]|jgi:histidinol-phosphatase